MHIHKTDCSDVPFDADVLLRGTFTTIRKSLLLHIERSLSGVLMGRTISC